MRALRAWALRLRGFLFRGRAERELAAELESHFQLHIDDNIRAGMTSEEARRAALVKFGPVEAIKDDYRDRAGVPALEIFLQDLRYGARRLRRQPGFTLLIVLTFAIGVGANAAMFGLVDALMFRTPDHVREPDRLVAVQRADNYVRYQELSERLRSVDLAASTSPQTLSFGAGADALPVRTQCVTPTFFPLLGVSALIGRTFASADDTPGSERTIVVSHGFWSRQFGADPDVVGKSASIAGRSYSVIGVAPPRFKGLELEPVDAWMLVAVSPEACSFTGTNLLRSDKGSWLSTIGRLREGVTLPQALTELAAVEAGTEPLRLSDGRVVETAAKFALLYPSRRITLTPDSRLALWLAGGATILLLLACANIAGLLSMRAVDRRREVAVRLQLGASRRRVFGQLLVEHLLTAALGGFVAIMVAVWLEKALRKFLPFGTDADLIDLRTLAVLTALALTAGIVSGTIPALQASKATAVRHLRAGHAVVRGRSPFRTALLVAQIAFALVLVVGAGLFARSVRNFRGDFAYDLDRVVTATIDFSRSGNRQPQQIRGTFELLLETVRRLPQVETAALTSGSILGSGGFVRVAGIRRSAGDKGEFHALTEITPDYFATLGLRITSGRAFTASDAASGQPVMVMNETLARTLFAGEAPIGKCALVGRTCIEVVGISEPFRATIHPGSQADSQVFVPFGAAANSGTVPQVLLVRTRKMSSGAVAAIAAALQGASSDLPYVDVRPLSDLADARARSWLLGATVFSLFGTLAVILAAVGIYGTLAFSIRQRTVEIGVRMALGAQRSDVAGMVLRQGAIVVVAGCTLGAAGAFAVSRYIRSLLFNVAPGDPNTFAIAAAVIAAAALAGCVIPAARAARTDPAVALRSD